MAIISHDFEEIFCANNDNQCMLVFSSIGLALRCTALLKTNCGNALELTQYYSRASHHIPKRPVQSRVEGKATQVECRGGGVDYLGSCFKGPQGMEAESA